MPILSEQQKQELADLIRRDPSRQDIVLDQVRSKGYNFDDLPEFLPISGEVEAEEFAKGFGQELSLGVFNPGEKSEQAGDVDLFGFNFSPSRMAGQFLGAVAPALAGYSLAGKGVRALAGPALSQLPKGVSGSKLVGQTFSRGGGLSSILGNSPKVRRGLQILGGEAIPGAASGALRSEGDLRKAGEIAALWTAAGLIGEGVGRVAIRAIRKIIRAGRKGISTPITPKEESALTDVAEKMVDTLEGNTPDAEQAIQTTLQSLTHNIQEKVIENTPKRLRSMIDKATQKIDISAALPGHAVDNISTAIRPLFQMIAAGQARGAQIASTFHETLRSTLSTSGIASKRIDAILGSNTDLTSEVISGVETGRISSEMADEILSRSFKGELDIPETVSNLRARRESLEGIDDIAEGKTWQQKVNEAIDKEEAKSPAQRIQETEELVKKMRSKGWFKEVDIEAEPVVLVKMKSGKTVSGHIIEGAGETLTLKTKTGQREVKYSDIDVINKGKPENQFSSGIQSTYDDLIQIPAVGHNIFARSKTGKEIVGEILSKEDNLIQVKTSKGKTEWLDTNDLSAARGFPAQRGGSDIPGEQRPVTAEQIRRITSLEHRIKQEQGQISELAKDLSTQNQGRTRIIELQNTLASTISRNSDEVLSTMQAQRKNIADEGPANLMPDMPDLHIANISKLIVPTSQLSLGGHSATKAHMRWTLAMQERIGRDSHQFLQQVRQALEPLSQGVGRGDPLRAAFGSVGAREALGLSRASKTALFKALMHENPVTITTMLNDHPEIKQAYAQLVPILKEIADKAGVGREMLLDNALQHMFEGQSGLWRLNRLADELGSRGSFLRALVKPGTREEVQANMQTLTEMGFSPAEASKAGTRFRQPAGRELPGQRFLKARSEIGIPQMFNHDLDAFLYIYVRAGIEKGEMDVFLKRTAQVRATVPEKSLRGDPMLLKTTLDDWALHIAGEPTNARRFVAKWWRDNETFNRWTDKLVERVGGAKEKGILTKARLGELQPDGSRGAYKPGDEAEALNFFEEMAENARTYTKEGFYKNDPLPQKLRAQTALAIDDIRAAMADPSMRAPILSQMYRLMVVNKLGFNLSHAIVNSTQFITNSIPVLGVKNAARGIKRFIESGDNVFANGRSTQEVLDEAGVLLNTPEAFEFVPDQIGFLGKATDIALTPARISEQFVRGSTLLGAYEQFLEKGWKHIDALSEAVAIVQKTQFPFNRAGVAPIMHAPSMRLLLMFKSYPLHQFNFSAELLDNAIKKGEIEPLMLHLLGYVTLAGAGATLLSSTAIGERTQHPVADFARIETKEDAAFSLTGPAAMSFLMLLQGQYERGVNEWTPLSTARGRIERATRSEEQRPTSRLLQLTGLQR